MALFAKTARCGACGSTEITCSADGTTGRCRACGAEGPVMSAADLACVNRAQLMGAQQEELDDLRRRYKNLGLTSWTTQQRVQIG